MGRGSRSALVCGTRLRGCRPQLAIVNGRDRSRGLHALRRGVLRDQDACDRPLRPARIRCRTRQATTHTAAGSRVARSPRSAWFGSLRRRRRYRCAHRGVRGSLLAGAVVAAVPTGLVPMAAQVRRVGGNGDVMARADGDLVMAPRADIGLGGLVRLHPPDLDHPEAAVPQAFRYPRSAHANRPMTARTAATTNT
jgi:hypothetical protein